MTDELLFERLAAHAGPANVDPGFEDRLYSLLQQELRRSERPSRPVLLLVAALAAILAISAAVAVGSGVIKLPWLDESPTPSPSPGASESLGPSATPLTQVPTWSASGSMLEARMGHTATVLPDGRVLVVGGSNSSGGLASAELYDPNSRSWASTASMNEVRAGHTATLLQDGTVLVAGGGGSGIDPLASAELYDPSTESWAAIANMHDVRSGHTATLLPDGTVLVAGGSSLGRNGGGDLASAEVYDPQRGSWIAAGSMSGAGAGRTATLLANGAVLVIGGTEIADLYDSTSGTWATTGSTSGVRIGHTATFLSNGAVLVTGGMAGTGALTFADLYDPDTGQWTPTGSLIEARLSHGATRLRTGMVLVAGGVNSVIDGGAASASSETYDPLRGSWIATPSMAESRSDFTMTLLPDGTVLVVGGRIGGEALTSAEVYNPGSGA